MARSKERRSTVDGARKKVATDLADQNLKKHVAAIHINNRLTLTQRKASNVLLYNAYENLLTARVHRIRVKDLAEAIGFNTHNLDPLKEALKTLARTMLEWNILDEDGHQEEWGATTLLAQAVIKGGYCVYAYSPELCEKLYRPEIYALLNLSIQRKFSSSYALALYENCLRYRRIGTTGWIGLDILRRLLGISDAESYYQDFRKFNDKVLKPAVRQVNETSDLLLEINYQRDRRKVSAVRFLVNDNPQMLLFAQHQAALTIASETPPVIEHAVEENPETRLEYQERFRERLSAFGLSTRQIRIALASHDPDYLEGNLAVVERDLHAGKVHNLPAYLLAALRDDYRPAGERYKALPSAPAMDDSALADYPERVEAMQPVKLIAAPSEYSHSPILAAQQLQTALDRLTAAERDALMAEYVVRLEQGDGFETKLILGLYRKSGMKSKIVESHFRAFARERLLGVTHEVESAAYSGQPNGWPDERE